MNYIENNGNWINQLSSFIIQYYINQVSFNNNILQYEKIYICIHMVSNITTSSNINGYEL